MRFQERSVGLVASLLLTTEAMIADSPDDKPAAGGGMPDMGGMM